MKISDILREDKITLTYEVFPPARAIHMSPWRRRLAR